IAPSSRPASSIAVSVRCSSTPSTSNLNGLAAVLPASWTDTAWLRSSKAIIPQHSLGKSRRACATICSMRSEAMTTAPSVLPRALALFGLQRRPLFLVVVGLARERLLELTHPLADGPAHFGQLLRAEDDQGDHQD